MTTAIIQLDGFGSVNAHHVKRIRLSLGPLRRVSVRDEQLEQAIREALVSEYRCGDIDDFGKGMLYTHMRSKYHFVGRYV